MRSIDLRVSLGMAVAASAAVAMLSWRMGYVPARRAHQQHVQQQRALEERIAQWEAILQAAGGQPAWTAREQQRLEALNAQFPPQTHLPQLLNALVESLKSGELKLINVTQGNLEAVQVGGQPLVLDGKPCYRLPVTVTAEGRYHALRSALQRLSGEGFPGMVSIAQLDLRSQEQTGNRLAATLQLYLYVIGTS